MSPNENFLSFDTVDATGSDVVETGGSYHAGDGSIWAVRTGNDVDRYHKMNRDNIFIAG